MKKVKLLFQIILCVLGIALMLILGCLFFLNAKNEYIPSNDQQWGIGHFLYMNPFVDDTWSSYIVCHLDSAPDHIVVNYTDMGKETSIEVEREISEELTLWERFLVGGSYKALYSFIVLSPTLPELEDVSIQLPDQTVVSFLN